MIKKLIPIIENHYQKDFPKQINASSLTEESFLLASSYLQDKRPIVIVKENSYQALLLYQKLTPLLKHECALFSIEESLRVLSIAASKEPGALRIETLFNLTNNPNKVIVTHVGGLVSRLMNPDYFKELSFSLSIDQRINLNDLKTMCQKAGYSQVARVDQPLCFAIRGGILDIFSMNYDYPVRIEFFDDEIESIKFFDISTQRTIETVNNIDIIVASEYLFSDDEKQQIQEKTTELLEKQKTKLNPHEYDQLQDNITFDLEYIINNVPDSKLAIYFSYTNKEYTLLDYLPKCDVIISNTARCDSNYKQLQDETVSYVQEMVQENRMLPVYSLYVDYPRYIDRLDPIINNPYQSYKELAVLPVSLPNQPLYMTLRLLYDQAQSAKVVLCLKEAELRLVIEECVKQSIPYILEETSELTDNGLYLSTDALDEGFELPFENILVYTSTECFNIKRKTSRFTSKFAQAEVLSNYDDLNKYDYIVHQQHGIGQYLGLITKQINGFHRDFLQIIFKGNDELLVPLEQFQLVRKFVSSEGVVPKLNKLGSKEWTNTKNKLKDNVSDIAENLIELYSEREDIEGYAYQPDTVEQIQFENEFEYELTPDQQVAIREIKKDLESTKPMDRLLCGDVGFGKTEVAITASFKVILENKQVCFLCPTTILSLQHYKTYQKRFQDYPVRIEMLNRFVPPLKQKEILRDLKEGKVDVIIGTHRLLSKDVHFKDLGFLIIDEEQRFGVEHKEKIKEYKKSVDVLSLSATPIPRTLQMSLIGIRPCSQLNTPPTNRMPIQTYVVEKNKGLIQDVIERELGRSGQVFYLYNNIDQIYHLARSIQAQIPYARVSVAHGRMSREEIEDVMMSFSEGESDVLICTTIIETGIDIPNANTIIIENADRFGLSQLYQIKGRVGRSDKVAYAYLMVNEFKQLSEIAEKRLQTIKDFAQLGSGYKIAMRDLTIRGAGDLLGANQSGFINTVGIDYYIEMLNEAIAEKKGIKVEKKKELVKPKIQLDSYIPSTFSPQDNEKIDMYKRIDTIDNISDLQELVDETIDNYGHLPKPVYLLFEKKHLELCINDPNVENFKESKQGYELTFSEDFSFTLDGLKLFETLSNVSKDIKIQYIKGRIIIIVPKANDTLEMSIKVYKEVYKCIKRS